MGADTPATGASAARAKWLGQAAAGRYARQRFGSQRAALRDPMLVERILDLHGVRASLRPVLDAPCGAGRLRGVLERRGLRCVGADFSRAMLDEAAQRGEGPLVQADLLRLPFRDDAFDVVVCCRLLHHLNEVEEFEAAVRELVRVSQRLIVASFWDSASWHAWRRRVGLRRGEGPSGRHAVSKRTLRRVFEQAGAEVSGFHHSFRFVSQQTFVVAHKRAPVRAPRALASRIFGLDLARVPGTLGPAGS
jgi:SAM-dependent methyltransferase